MPLQFPPQPYAGYPLKPHRNGQWYKSIWNSRTKRSEQFYFGSWKGDRKGERALHDSQLGWLARKSSIEAGNDNARVPIVESIVTLGELMSRFLEFKRGKVKAGDLSARTLGDYLLEVERFVGFMKPATAVSALRPEHFSAYMKYLNEKRNLGRHSRRRVRAYLNAFLRYGVKSGWFAMPSTGPEWTAPSVDAASIRLAKLRAGKTDYSDRLVKGSEIDGLLARATPTFKAIILLAVNCGLGPADIGRLRWNMIDLERGRLKFPRPKTGVERRAYIWRKTRKAIRRLGKLRHNKSALLREGQTALMFVTRTGRPFYREREVYKVVDVCGQKVKKLSRIATDSPISTTFRRMARELKMEGLTIYRLRHAFKTFGKLARDREAMNLAMGHSDRSVGGIYDHEIISWRRLRKIAIAVYRRLWPTITPTAGKLRSGANEPRNDANGAETASAST